MRTTRRAAMTVALLIAGVASTGCATTVTGRAGRTETGTAERQAPLASVLPDESEMRGAAGNPLSMNGFPPLEGGVEVLSDGIRDDAKASPIACAGVSNSLMKLTYETSPVRTVATADFTNYDTGVTASSVSVGAVRLATSDAAQALFATFTQQWRDCNGQTVVLHTHDTTNTELTSRIEDVAVTGAVLSATIISSDNHHTPEFPVERAVGVKADVIVEADVADTAPGARAGDRAIKTVNLMLDKVADVG